GERRVMAGHKIEHFRFGEIAVLARALFRVDHRGPARTDAGCRQALGEAEIPKTLRTVLGLAHARAPARAGADQMSLLHESLIIPTEHDAPLDHGLEHAALHRSAVERRVLRFGAEAVDFNTSGSIEIEQHEIRRSSLREPSGGQAENFRRTLTQSAERLQ